MLRVKFKLIISEVEVQEDYVGRKKNVKENIIEKEFNIREREDLEFYEYTKNNEDMIKRMELAYELNESEKQFIERNGTQMDLCKECLMPINAEQEKDELSQEGWEFRNFCIDCERNMRLEIDESFIFGNDADIESERDIDYSEDDNDYTDKSENIESNTRNNRIIVINKKRKREKVLESPIKNKRNKRDEKDLYEAVVNGSGSDNEMEIDNESWKERLIRELETEKTVNEGFVEIGSSELTLRQKYERLEENKKKTLQYYYDIGEEFIKRINEEKDRVRRMREKKKSEGKISGELYDEILGLETEGREEREIIEMRRRIKRERHKVSEETRIAKRIYKLFEEEKIGKDKMVTTICQYHTIERCTNEEIEQVKEYFRYKE